MAVSSCARSSAFASSASLGWVSRAGFDARRRSSACAEDRRLDLRFLVALLGLLDEVRHASLERFQVGKHQLGLDRLRVRDRIDAAFDVGHVAALETAQDVDDRVDLANVGEELVAEALAFARAANEAGDVDELDLGLDFLGGLGDCRDLVEPLVGDSDAADIRLDRAEGIVRRLRGSGSVKALKSVDLPTFGRPTMPQRKPMMILIAKGSCAL